MLQSCLRKLLKLSMAEMAGEKGYKRTSVVLVISSRGNRSIAVARRMLLVPSAADDASLDKQERFPFPGSRIRQNKLCINSTGTRRSPFQSFHNQLNEGVEKATMIKSCTSSSLQRIFPEFSPFVNPL